MSWINRVRKDISITTGDGKTYTPLYVIGGKSIDYHIAQFDFPNIPGTLVKKGEPKGRTFPIEIIFQGENHIEQSNEFEKSANDKRPWKVSHPMYDTLLVHASSLRFDTSKLNNTRITGDLLETITDEPPFTSVDPVDQAAFIALETKEISALAFSNSVDIVPTDINQLTTSTNQTYELGAALVKSGEQANEYYNKYQDALNSISNAANDSLTMAQSVIDLFSFPSEFADDLKRRFYIFQQQLIKLNDQLSDITTPNEKQIYQMQYGAIITGMVNATVNPLDSDYQSVSDVVSIINQLTTVFNGYITNLDALKSPNASDPNSYVPDYDAINSITNTVNYTVSELFNIALDAKQERVHVLTASSNVILLAHRFYGLDTEGTNTLKMIDNNNIGLNEILGIEPGREIVYYV